MTTKSKQVAFLLETYLIRDVSKIVYEYLVLEGINKFLCGEPRFELWVHNIEECLGPSYKELFYDHNLRNYNWDQNRMEDFLQMVPSDFYRAKKRPELVLYKVVGEMQFNQDKIDLVFEEGIRLPEQLPQFGNPEDLVFHIVEITSNQVLFSYFPVFFADHEDHQHHDDCFIHWCLKVNKLQTEINQSLITKTRIQFSILNESNFNAKFPKPFDSKYPL